MVRVLSIDFLVVAYGLLAALQGGEEGARREAAGR
jgi:hypothetical protein